MVAVHGIFAVSRRTLHPGIQTRVTARRLNSYGAWAQLLRDMWDLSYQTRDGTCIPCIARWILNQWITRKSLNSTNLLSYSLEVKSLKWVSLDQIQVISRAFYIPPGISRAVSIFLPFLVDHLLFLAHGHFSIFKAINVGPTPHVAIFLTFFCLKFSIFKNLGDYTGPTWIIQNNIHILR